MKNVLIFIGLAIALWLGFSNYGYSCATGYSQCIFVTTSPGSNQTVTSPSTWNNADNAIECIGGGASGAHGASTSTSGGGGGGGAYVKILNFTFASPGITTATAQVGVGGGATDGTPGGDTWFNSTAFPTTGDACGAKGGTIGSSTTATGGAGGTAAASYASPATGAVKNNGGTGGTAGASNAAGGGGGGAGGASGAGGSPAGGPSAGGQGDGSAGGTGGAVGNPGGNGNPGTESNGGGGNAGSGGGGGGGNASASTGGDGGNYGAGGGGGGRSTGNGGSGIQGAIVLNWNPKLPSTRASSLGALGVGNIGTAAPASYTGPGDIVTGWKAWYGLRAFNAAYATGSNPAVDLHNDTTGAFTATINILSTGDLDIATATTVIAGGSSKIGKFYDQSGNGFHMTQSNVVFMPILTLSGVFGSSRPATTWDVTGTDTKMTSSSLTQAQPMSFSSVVNPGTTAANAPILRNVGDTVKFGTRTNIPSIYVVAGVSEISQTSTNGATNRAQGVINGASSLVSINGATSATGNAGSAGISAEGLFINFQGHIGEVGLRTGAFSGGDITALESNQSAYGY